MANKEDVVMDLIAEYRVSVAEAEHAFAQWEQDLQGQIECQGMSYSYDIADYIFDQKRYWSF